MASNRWPLTSSPKARRAANGEPQTGHRSPIGSPSVLYRRVLHVRHLRCGIGSLLLVVRPRQVRVARIARTGRVCLGPGTAHRLRVQASLGVDRRGNPPRAVIASQLAAPTRCPILLSPRHRLHAFPSLSFPSLCWNISPCPSTSPDCAERRVGTCHRMRLPVPGNAYAAMASAIASATRTARSLSREGERALRRRMTCAIAQKQPRTGPSRRRCFERHCRRAARRSQRCRVGRKGAELAAAAAAGRRRLVLVRSATLKSARRDVRVPTEASAARACGDTSRRAVS